MRELTILETLNVSGATTAQSIGATAGGALLFGEGLILAGEALIATGAIALGPAVLIAAGGAVVILGILSFFE